MVPTEFRRIFSSTMLESGFRKSGKGWIFRFTYPTTCDCVVTLEKSRWGDQFQCMLKIYVKELFGEFRTPEQMVRDVGHIFKGLPQKFSPIFNLEESISDERRAAGVQEYVHEELAFIASHAYSVGGLFELAQDQKIVLLPAVRVALSQI